MEPMLNGKTLVKVWKTAREESSFTVNCLEFHDVQLLWISLLFLAYELTFPMKLLKLSFHKH